MMLTLSSSLQASDLPYVLNILFHNFTNVIFGNVYLITSFSFHFVFQVSDVSTEIAINGEKMKLDWKTANGKKFCRLMVNSM